MAIVRIQLTEKDKELSPEQIERIERASHMPITYDEDCPRTTPEMLAKFRRVKPHSH